MSAVFCFLCHQKNQAHVSLWATIGTENKSRFGANAAATLIDLYEDIAAAMGIVKYNGYSNRTVEEVLVRWRGANV